MKTFVSCIFGLLMPLVILGIWSFIQMLMGFSPNLSFIPLEYLLIIYVVLAIFFSFCKYYELSRKEREKAEQEEERQRKEDLEDKMRAYLEKKLNEE